MGGMQKCIQIDNSSGAQSQKYISGDIWFNAGYNTLCLTPEGGFIFTGMTDVAAGNDEIVAIKTDGDGNQLSLKIINEGSYPEAWGLVWQNGSYVYYGGTTSGGAGYFLRLMRFNM